MNVLTLEGRAIRLVPLESEHAEGLATAAAEDRSSYAYTWVPDGIDEAQRYVQAALDHQRTGHALVFTVVRTSDAAIIGTTRFLDLEVFVWPPPWPPGVAQGPVPSEAQPPTVAEVGSTWFAASAMGTGVNAECKLLMLTRAFDVWGVLRVTLKTDARNSRSRAAIAKIGAQFEGVRRAHGPAIDGGVRDTAYYSITKAEWPQVRFGLQERVADV